PATPPSCFFVSSEVRIGRSLVRRPRAALTAPGQRARESTHKCKQPAPPHRPGPTPELPCMLALKHGEENDLGAPDEILQWHIADCSLYTAVGRVVTVVAHHEVMAVRHHVFFRVVVETVVDQIESRIAYPVRQRLAPALDTGGAVTLLGLDEVVDALAFD